MVVTKHIMEKLHVMIVSLPGTWQRMLQNNMESYPYIRADSIASGGLSALELIKDQPPELLVIDSSIPPDDADALVQKVKEENPEIKIIVLTDTAPQRRRILRSGADYAVQSSNYEEEIDRILHELNNSLNLSLS
jgi:DNA-binding NarL/FixJ family response regulator